MRQVPHKTVDRHGLPWPLAALKLLWSSEVTTKNCKAWNDGMMQERIWTLSVTDLERQVNKDAFDGID